MSTTKISLTMARSSSSPEDKGACNSAYLQYKRQNSNMADKTFNSTFLIKEKEFFTSFVMSLLRQNESWRRRSYRGCSNDLPSG